MNIFLRFNYFNSVGRSAAAVSTARMRRMQQPMLHFTSSLSCDFVISIGVCSVCAMVRVRVCRWVRAFVCWNPTFQLFVFCSARSSCLTLRTLLPFVCGPLLCMCGHDVCVYALCVLRVRTAMVQQQSHSKFVWTTSMRVLTYIYITYIHLCVMCACYDT